MAETVALPQPGGCACGALRYALSAPPLLAYACHCHGCQTRSGAAFSLTLVARSADFEPTGEADVRRREISGGRVVEQMTCPACGVHVWSRRPDAADFMSLKAGTLDDAGWVVPIAQTWVESAIPWAVIPGVRQVDWADFDFVALGQDWQASAPAFGPR